MTAVLHGYLNCATALLEMGASLEVKNSSGKSAKEIAVEHKMTSLIWKHGVLFMLESQ
jgi:ankyrin repeat protein